MTDEQPKEPEPVIWFEGTLIREPVPAGRNSWLLETMPDSATDRRKITVRASGTDHDGNIRRNARKGSRIMVRGTAGDEGSGVDIDAASLAFAPSQNDEVR